MYVITSVKQLDEYINKGGRIQIPYPVSEEMHEALSVFTRAQRVFSSENFVAALDAFAYLLDRWPNFVAPRVCAADCLSRLSHTDEALNQLEIAHSLAPTDPDIHRLRARILEDLGHFDEALPERIAAYADTNKPFDIITNLEVGEVLIALGQFANAVQWLLRALEGVSMQERFGRLSGKTYEEVRFRVEIRLAKVYGELGDIESAMTHLQVCIELRPEDQGLKDLTQAMQQVSMLNRRLAAESASQGQGEMAEDNRVRASVPYWKKRQRDPESNTKMVCVFVTISDVDYFYRFIEKNGDLVLHSYQDEHELDEGRDWLAVPVGFEDTIYFDGYAEALIKARNAMNEWLEEEALIATKDAERERSKAEYERRMAAQREAERQRKLEAQRQATIEAERQAAREAQRQASLEAQRQATLEAERAPQPAELDAINKKPVKERMLKKHKKAAIFGSVVVLVVLLGWFEIGRALLVLIGLLLLFMYLVVKLVPVTHADRPQRTTQSSHTSRYKAKPDGTDTFMQGTISGFYGGDGPSFLPSDTSKMSDREKEMFIIGMLNGNQLSGRK